MPERIVNIIRSFNSSEFGSNHQNVYELYSVNTPPGILAYTGFITDLRIKSYLPSKQSVPLPTFEAGTTRTEKAEALRQYQWDTEHIVIAFCLRIDNGNWHEIFSVPLKNHEPYFIQDLLSYLTTNPAYAIGENTAFGVKAIDASYGLLSGSDEIVIHGVVREELIESNANVLTVANSLNFNLSANVTSKVANFNQQRKGLLIQNLSSNTVTINFVSSFSLNNGIILQPNGHYEFNLGNLYLGDVYAVSNFNGNLQVTEYE